MIEVLVEDGQPPKPLWIDVTAPSKDELAALARDYHLHPTSVEDCLEPMHLPKYEHVRNTTFIIVRIYDPQCTPQAYAVQGMTRKIAIFVGEDFLLTVHRSEMPFIEEVRANYPAGQGPFSLQTIMFDLLTTAVETFYQPLEDAERMVHDFENVLLRRQDNEASWEGLFRAKCRITNIKRLLWHTLNAVQRLAPRSHVDQPLNQDLRERIESLLFFADALLDDLNNLLTIQLSLASNRTNEVMRVLTVFSVFFMPITFIVGVYGMNFRFMPELDWRYGYHATWASIALVVMVIYLWFRRRGWLDR